MKFRSLINDISIRNSRIELILFRKFSYHKSILRRTSKNFQLFFVNFSKMRFGQQKYGVQPENKNTKCGLVSIN